MKRIIQDMDTVFNQMVEDYPDVVTVNNTGDYFIATVDVPGGMMEFLVDKSDPHDLAVGVMNTMDYTTGHLEPRLPRIMDIKQVSFWLWDTLVRPDAEEFDA